MIISRYKGIVANSIAALMGTVTPFCSCASIPIFIGFTIAGLPLGVTFSFLISSPMVDLGSLILLMSTFGWKIAVLYVLLGLVIAVAGGTLIEKLHMEDQIILDVPKENMVELLAEGMTLKERLFYAWERVYYTVKKVFPYVLIGVGIGAIIHNWIPENWVIRSLGNGNSFPSVIMLKKVLTTKLLAIFITICIVGIILVGYAFNLLQMWLI